MKRILAFILVLTLMLSFTSCGKKDETQSPNTTIAAGNPLSDVRVRKAISMAIDREQITETVSKAGELPAMGLVPYGFTDAEGNDFRENAGNYYLQPNAQIEQAKALLTEAGYPEGKGIPEIELMYNTGENHKAIAEAVQSMLSEIGIKVKLSNQEWQVFQETRGQASYKDMARHSWIGDYLDPMTFLDMYASVAGKPNPQGGNAYLSSDYDKQIDIAIKTQGKEHYDAYYKAEEILMEDAYIVPIYFYVNKVMANDNLVDWYLSPTGKFWFGDASFSNGTKQLKWNLGVDPKTLDPALNSATDGSHIINNIYEGLYRNKGTGNVPGMAKSHDIVTNSDGTVTYTFHLRDDIKWSDGKPVKADDFEFAWKRAIDPTLGAEYSYMFAPIKNAKAIIAGDMKKDELAVKALDDKTLEVILERPTAYFIDLTAFPTFMPVRSDIVDNEGKWAKDTQKIITNGPFVLSEYAMGSHIVLKKNDNYYNKNAVKLDSIYSAMITEESSMLSAYKAGDVDLITNAPVEEIPQLIAQGEMQTLPYIGTYYFVINANAK